MQSPPGGIPGNAVLAHQVADAGHPGTGRKLAGVDTALKVRGYLSVGRIGRIMIDFHMTRLNMPDLPR